MTLTLALYLLWFVLLLGVAVLAILRAFKNNLWGFLALFGAGLCWSACALSYQYQETPDVFGRELSTYILFGILIAGIVLCYFGLRWSGIGFKAKTDRRYSLAD